MKLLYVTENINAVFHSQVVVLLNKLQEEEYFEEIHLAIGIRDRNTLDKIEHLDSKIKLITFKTYPMYPIFNSLTEYSILKLMKSMKIDQQYIIHTRIEFLGSLVYNSYIKLHSQKPNLLIDIRGSLIEEIKIYGKMNYLFKLFKLFNYESRIQKVLTNTKYINTVSNELKNYIELKYNINKKYISVIPTIASEKFVYNKEIRIKTRNILGLKDSDIFFIFSSGSTQGWQNDDLIVNTLINKGYKILMLTKKKYDNFNVISKFVPYEEVPNFLNAADIGIIIREKDTVNKVASPIKFSEYLSCGLPIIANDSVKIITDLIKNHSCGLITNIEDINDDAIEKLLQLDRVKISELGLNKFGIKVIVDNYISIYKKMSPSI